MQPMQPPLLANELNPEVILAAQIVLGLFVLIITLLLAFPRFQQVEVVELIFEAVGTLVRIVVLLQHLIRDLHQIISMAHDGFQQLVSVLELIEDVVGSLVSLVDLLLRLIRTCRGIWSIWTARQPAAVANDPQNEVPPTDAEADTANGQNDVMMNEESNIRTQRFRGNLSSTCNTTFTTSTVHNMLSLLFQVALLCV